SRRALNEVVTDALIKRGDTVVSHTLANNNGARFSEQGYATLVNGAARDVGLTEKLGLRLDIPINLLRELLARATAAVRDRLLKAAPQEMRQKILAAVQSIADEVQVSEVQVSEVKVSELKVLRPVDYASAQHAVLA